MPWYRPTRVCHVVSGSDYGWRSGSGKWPTYYEDSLPPVIDIGPGSPTGVVFGTGAAFPPEYQDALYILDWTFGTIHAVHLRPRGASYTGVKEDFVSGSPLPVSDAVVAADGAFYFTVGGRGTQSALYRITFRGREAPPPAAGAGDGGAEAQDRGAEAGSARAGGAEAALEAAQRRTERRSLERFHGREDPAAVDEAWPFLAHEDRFLRHAARLAIESQPVAVWKERALAETRPRARVAAAVALARAGGSEVQGELLDALRTWDPAALEEGELLGLLRAYALSFIRQGRPSRVQADAIVAQLDPYLPSPSDAVSSELVQVLVYLNAPGIVEKTLRLVADERPEAAPDWAGIIDRNPGYGGAVRRLLEDHPPSRRIGYAFHLRNVRYGWSLSEREAFFRFINEASKHPGGASYAGFLKNLRADALANCSPAERSALASITGESLEPPPPFAVEPLSGAGRVWTVPLALGEVEGGLSGRSFEGGRNVFHAASCAKCHRFDGAGGAIGPDLSSVRSRFSHADLLEAVIEPSKVISDQYRSSLVVTKDGRTLVGLVVETAESDGPRVLEVHTADVDKPPVRVEASEVARREPSPLSQMPEGLANALSRDELLDLVAYLMSRGDPSDRVFEAPE
jgi:putative heme-binding domain-containing protein